MSGSSEAAKGVAAPSRESVGDLLGHADPLRESRVAVRCRALLGLARHGATPAVLAALESAVVPAREPAWHARAAAVRALGLLHVATPGVVAVLAGALDPGREPEWYVRSAAARALAMIGSGEPAAAAALRGALDEGREPDQGVRAAARDALAALGAAPPADADPPATAAPGLPGLTGFLGSVPGGPAAMAEQEAIVAVGAWLRRLRGATTLETLAAEARTTPATLSLLERGLGERGPTIGLVARILHALGYRLRLARPDPAEGEVLLLAEAEAGGDAAGGDAAAGLAPLRGFLDAAPGGALARAEQSAIVDSGAFLRALRGERTLQRVAAEARTTASSLSLLERGLGERGPTIGLVARILHALGYRLACRDAPARQQASG